MIAIRFAVNGVVVAATTMRAVADAAGRVVAMSTIGTLQLDPGDIEQPEGGRDDGPAVVSQHPAPMK